MYIHRFCCIVVTVFYVHKCINSLVESVRMQYVEDDRKVYNNVVINRFQTSVGSDYGNSKRNGKYLM